MGCLSQRDADWPISERIQRLWAIRSVLTEVVLFKVVVTMVKGFASRVFFVALLGLVSLVASREISASVILVEAQLGAPAVGCVFESIELDVADFLPVERATQMNGWLAEAYRAGTGMGGGNSLSSGSSPPAQEGNCSQVVSDAVRLGWIGVYVGAWVPIPPIAELLRPPQVRDDDVHSGR